MQIESFIGPICGALGVAFGLYVKDKAHEAAKATIAEKMDGALAKFKNDLFAEMDRTYRRAGESDLMFEMRDDRLDNLETRLDILEKSA